MKKYNICILKLNCAIFNCLEIALHKIWHFEKLISGGGGGGEGGFDANLHNFKSCIIFDPVGILWRGFQYFGFLFTVI